jgi:peptidoglycan hydrolase CwlO-like protein
MSLIEQHKNNTFYSNHTTRLLCGLFILFLFTTFLIGKENFIFAQENTEDISLEERQSLTDKKREEIKEVQEKINSYEEEIKAQQKKERSLKGEILIYENNVNKNELEIKKTKLAIETAEMELEEIEKKIEEGEKRVMGGKDALKSLIKLLYVSEQDSFLEILMTNDNISDFFNEINVIDSVKDKIFKTIIGLKKEKEDLNYRNKEIEEQQEEMGSLIRIKSYQNDSLEELKNQKNDLLEVTKGEEKQFQELLEENKNILPSLQAQLHELQSLGKKIEFDDAFGAAKHISSIIGVRPAYLLGILKVESDLGKNTGSGNWNDDMYNCYLRISKIAKTASRKAYYVKRAETEKNAYFSIVNRLGIDPDSVKVSREPTYGCGGAMGPAQFIPSTWLAYEQRISDVTGNNPPNPWDLTDAMTAMAVKVSDISGVIGGNYEAEYEAAGRYLGGGSWRSKNLFFYPNKVMLFADLYEKELGL